MTVVGEAFLAIKAQADQRQFEQDLSKQVEAPAKRVVTNVAKILGSAAVAGGIRKLVQGGIAELEEASAAQAQTAAAIQSTGGAANVSAEHIEKLASSQLKLTGVDDELIQKGANLLLTFTGVRNEVGKGNDIFDRATKTALDLSRAGFGSVESASVLLGKALNDPVQGLTALQRVGVRLTDDQKNLVKELVATGDTLGAQKVILEEVNRQVGGSAEAYGKTLPGQLAIARESMANTEGQLLAGMAPALQFTAGAATFLTDQFAKQPEVLQAVEGGLILVVGGLGSIITPLKAGVDLWRTFGGGAQAAAAQTAQAAAAGAAATTGVSGVGVAATNSAAGLEGLYASSGRAGGGLRGVGTAAVGAVGQIGLLVTAITLLGHEAETADLPGLSKGLQHFADSGELGGEAADALGTDLKTLKNAIEDVFAPSTASKIDNATFALTRLGLDTKGSLEDSRQVIEDLDQALADLAGSNPEAAAAALAGITKELSASDADRLTGSLEQYNDVVETTGPKSKEAAGQIEGVHSAASGAAPGVEDLTGATGELGDATGETTDELTEYEQKLQDARDAVDALFDTTESSIDAQFRYKDAQDSTADALVKLNDLQKAGKTGTDEYRRATDDAAEIMFRQAQAAADMKAKQYELNGVTLDGAQKAGIQKAELERLRDTLAPGNPLRKHLDGMIWQLAAIPAKKSVTVEVLTGQALVQLNRFAGVLHDRLITQGIRVSVSGGGGLTLASGGPVPFGGLPVYAAAGVGVPGGPRGTDTVPAWLTPGEWVVNRQAVSYWGTGMMDAINRRQPLGNVPSVTFAPGSVVVHAAPGMSAGDARQLGSAFVDGAAQTLQAHGIQVLGRVQ